MAYTNRTRSKSVPNAFVSTSDVAYRYDYGVLKSTTSYNGNVAYGTLNNITSSSSSITDQITTPGTYNPSKLVNGVWTGDPPFKSCSNSKSWTNLRKSPAMSVVGNWGASRVVVDFAGYPQSCMAGLNQPQYNLLTLGHGYGTADTVKTTYFGTDFSSAYSFIKNEMMTDESFLGMKEAFNVLLFIAELKDLRTLPNLFKKWKVSQDDISDKYLGINFGLLPLYSDAKAIMERMLKLDPAIIRWNEMAAAGKTINLHRSMPPPAAVKNHKAFKSYENGVTTLKYTTLNSNMNNGYTYGGFMASAGTGDFETSQRITAKCHVYFKPIPIPDNLIDNLKRHIWGVDRPLQAIWEAIPFSFVVDWFLNLQRYIDTFEQSQPFLKSQIVSVGCSIKVETVVSARLKLRVYSNSIVHVPSGELDQYTEWYNRYPLTPSSVLTAGKIYSQLELQQLNTSQALLGSALLHQLLRR